MQELLKLKMRYGWPKVLVRWTGLDAAGDTWELLDNLTNCEVAIAAFEHATGHSLPATAAACRRRRRAAADPAARLHGRGGGARRSVPRLCPRGAFSHVVTYTRQTSALRGKADTLLDAACFSRWTLQLVWLWPFGPGR